MYLDIKLLSLLAFVLVLTICSAVPVSEQQDQHTFVLEEQEQEESSFAPKKTVKRGIYGGYGGYGGGYGYGLGYGHHYPYYSFPLYKGFYGGYGHYPYLGLGYHGYGGYGGYGYGW